MPRLLHYIPLLLSLLLHFHLHHHSVISVAHDVAPSDDDEPIADEDDGKINNHETEPIEHLLTNLENVLQNVDWNDVILGDGDDLEEDSVNESEDDDQVFLESDAATISEDLLQPDQHVDNNVDHNDNGNFNNNELLKESEKVTITDEVQMMKSYLEPLLDHPDETIQKLLTNVQQIIQMIETDEEAINTVEGTQRLMDELEKLIREVEEMEGGALEEDDVTTDDDEAVEEEEEEEEEETNDVKETNDWKGLQVWIDGEPIVFRSILWPKVYAICQANYFIFFKPCYFRRWIHKSPHRRTSHIYHHNSILV